MASCAHYSPKPEGYFRIDLPEAAYYWQDFADFSCRISEQAAVEPATGEGEGYFFNLVYNQWNARVYCSYFPVKKGRLPQLSEESRKLAYLHAQKADAIREQRFDRPEERLFGLLYTMEGRVASPTQFVLTDSLHAFLRGALYFDHAPAPDSITPVLEYINNDIKILMESMQWKK